jgi:hypothetical protein
MDKLTKKGILDKTKSDKLILINNKGEFYEVNKSIAYIWNMLDGTNTIEDISGELIKMSPMDPKELENGVNKIILQLKKSDLVE